MYGSPRLRPLVVDVVRFLGEAFSTLRVLQNSEHAVRAAMFNFESNSVFTSVSLSQSKAMDRARFSGSCKEQQILLYYDYHGKLMHSILSYMLIIQLKTVISSFKIENKKHLSIMNKNHIEPNGVSYSGSQTGHLYTG